MVAVPQVIMDPPDAFPHPSVPVVFADGCANLANSAHVVKFYMVRNDASLLDVNKTKVHAAAQIVMPLDGFVNMALFFQQALEELRRHNVVSDQLISQVKKAQAQVQGGR